MKRILVAALILVVPAPGARAGSFTFEAGSSVPAGSFAEPTASAFEDKGAESSFAFGLKYARPLVVVDLVSEISYVQFGERYQGPPEALQPPDAVERQDYTHTFIPATVGFRRSMLRALPVSPYLGAAIGLYAYVTQGNALVLETSGTGSYIEESFTAVIRPGINFSGGVVFDVPFSFDLAAEAKYHMMVFQGVGDDRADREYPYAIDVDSLNFWTLTVGLVF